MDPCLLHFPLLLPKRIPILNFMLTVLFFFCTHVSVSKQYEDAGLLMRLYSDASSHDLPLCCLSLRCALCWQIDDHYTATRSSAVPIYETGGPPFWPWVFVTHLLKQPTELQTHHHYPILENFKSRKSPPPKACPSEVFPCPSFLITSLWQPRLHYLSPRIFLFWTFSVTV